MDKEKEKRTYQQHCGLARALDVVGERWTLLIVRELLLGPKRYRELLERLDGLTTNLLARRLKEMEENGLIERNGRLYRLTPRGEQLETPILELGRWGLSLLVEQPRPEDRKDPSWALFAQKRHYQGGHNFRAEFDIDGRVFELVFTPEKLHVQERPAVDPDVRLKGTFPQLLGWLYQGQPLQMSYSGKLNLLTAALQLKAPRPSNAPSRPA